MSSRGRWVTSGGIFGCHSWEGGVLLDIPCIEARDALKILEGAGQLPQRRIFQPQMTGVPRSSELCKNSQEGVAG